MASLIARFQTQDRVSLNLQELANPVVVASIPFTFGQRAENRSFAIGPHLCLDGIWTPGPRGLGLLGRVDGGILGASNRHDFEFLAAAQIPNSSGGGTPTTLLVPPVSGTTSGPGVIPTLSVQTGMNWSVPLRYSCLNLAAGYKLDAWWFSATGHHAKENAIFDSLDRLAHGPFVSLNWGY